MTSRGRESWFLLLTAIACCVSPSEGFAVVLPRHHVLRTYKYSGQNSNFLFAKRKDNTLGKGFAKNVETPKETENSKTKSKGTDTPLSPNQEMAAPESGFLQPIEGGSTKKPNESKASDVSAEERAKKLLREKYGLKTLEEEQLNAKQLEQLEAQRKRTAELKAMAEQGEDIDFIAMIPGPVIKAIYTFLQAGIVITGTLFVASGLGITLEAWSKTSGDPLPENIDSFIVNTIEPNFTTMLLVLLGFSVSLGGLAAAQLGSKSAQYTEDN